MDSAQLREYWQNLWRHPYAGVLAMAAIVVMASLLAWQLGRLLWLFGAGSAERLPRPASVATLVLPARIEPQRIAGLFGETAAAAPGAEAQSTTLQLRLDGVMTNPSRELARAFIADRTTSKVLAYRPGDALPGGAKLLRVEALQVALERSGQEEILRFDKPGMPPAANAAQPSSAAQMQNALGAAASQLANSPMAALRQMGLRRTSQGYIVSITAPKDMLQRFGLQPGDRIVSINGQPVGKDLDADQKTMGQLQQAGSARVEVQRGEQTITLEQKL